MDSDQLPKQKLFGKLLEKSHFMALRSNKVMIDLWC